MQEPLSFDRVASHYDASTAFPPGIADTIARGLIAFGPLVPGARVLELAAGTGRITLPLLDAGVDITATDIAPRMLDHLRQGANALQASHDPAHGQLGQLTIREGDVTSLPDADARWDAVVAVAIFHLVPAWHRALDEALRVLAPSGVLLIGQGQSVGDDPEDEVAERWRDIVADLGILRAATDLPGAAFDTVVADLRGRGLAVEQRTLATWEAATTPRTALKQITERLWSRTWAVPDNIFDESVRRLDAWAVRHFGPRLDVPMPVEMRFVVARSTR